MKDWKNGDPDWGNNEGRGIIGALNYLSEKKVNSIYILFMNIGGDGQDVWPYSGSIDRKGSPKNDNLHFDISKLSQWETVFAHAQKKGINIQFVLNEGEEENKKELDNGKLDIERKLYYREMIARFGHYNALQWNLCEEYNHPVKVLSPSLIKSLAQYIKDVDPYNHPVSVHNCIEVDTWKPFFGDSRFDLTSIQGGGVIGSDNGDMVEWLRNQALSAGRKIPIFMDETISTSENDDEEHIIVDHKTWKQHVYGQSYIRKNVIYPIYFSGGSVELILHYYLETDNFKKFNKAWDYMYYARKFMEENLQFWEMEPYDVFLKGESGHGEVFAKSGEVYAIYFPNARNTGNLNLRAYSKPFTKKWYNPRTGKFEGAESIINGGKLIPLGAPPNEKEEDWVLLIKLKE
ncbi:hypothetical protein KAS50_02250 [bacterium]|nr:hypothetical protein [bacterium]